MLQIFFNAKVVVSLKDAIFRVKDDGFKPSSHVQAVTSKSVKKKKSLNTGDGASDNATGKASETCGLEHAQ